MAEEGLGEDGVKMERWLEESRGEEGQEEMRHKRVFSGYSVTSKAAWLQFHTCCMSPPRPHTF